MRDYGRVYSSFWQSPEIRALPEDARTLALYLLTTPHGNLLGCFRLPDAYAAEDLQWPIERVAEGFRKIVESGFATRDEATKWLFIRKFLKWNPFENPNVAKAAAKALDQVPAGELKSLLALAILEFGQHLGEGLRKGCETLAEPYRKPDPDPEPIRNLSRSKKKTVSSVVADAPPAAPTRPPDFDGTNAEVLNGKAVVQIAAGWELPDEWGLDAEALGFKPGEVLREAEKFRQYWVSGRGSGTRRSVTGWRQTWSNWLGKAAQEMRR
jgi:hypothetical protein